MHHHSYHFSFPYFARLGQRSPIHWADKAHFLLNPFPPVPGILGPKQGGAATPELSPNPAGRVSSLTTADSDASTTVVSLLTLHVHTTGWLSARGGHSRATRSHTPHVELLTRQVFSRCSWPHLQMCYFWREQHGGTARAPPRRTDRTCLSRVSQEGQGRRVGATACKDQEHAAPQLEGKEEEEKKEEGKHLKSFIKSACLPHFQRLFHDVMAGDKGSRYDL